MDNKDYLEKILGEQYNMKEYFVDTYTEPKVEIVEKTNANIPKVNEPVEEKKDEDVQILATKNNEPITQNSNVANIEEKKEDKPEEEEEKHQYQAIQVNSSIEDMYPNIYKVIDPIAELTVNNLETEDIDKKTIETMTNRIYDVVSNNGYENQSNDGETVQVSARHHNSILHDLIKILLLNKITAKPHRPHHRPGCHNNRCRNVSNEIKYQDVPFPEDNQE